MPKTKATIWPTLTWCSRWILSVAGAATSPPYWPLAHRAAGLCPAVATRWSHVCEHRVQRRRHAAEIERPDQVRCCVDLPAAVNPEEPPELLGGVAPPPGRLALERSEGREFAAVGEDPFDRLGGEPPDQLSLEVRLAHEEAELLEVLSSGDGAVPGSRKSTSVVALLARVAQAREPSVRTEGRDRPADVLRSA